MRILAISGSLREASSNMTLLRSLPLLSPPSVEISLFDGLARLPQFNPDLDTDPPNPEVKHLRDALNDSRAVLISTPEYAHSLPGSLKNALDWIVRSGELYTKPIAIFNASPRSTFAQAALREVLITMGAQLISEADVTVSIPGVDTPGPEAIAANPSYAEPLRSALMALSRAVENHP